MSCSNPTSRPMLGCCSTGILPDIAKMVTVRSAFEVLGFNDFALNAITTLAPLMFAELDNWNLADMAFGDRRTVEFGSGITFLQKIINFEPVLTAGCIWDGFFLNVTKLAIAFSQPSCFVDVSDFRAGRAGGTPLTIAQSAIIPANILQTLNPSLPHFYSKLATDPNDGTLYGCTEKLALVRSAVVTQQIAVACPFPP